MSTANSESAPTAQPTDRILTDVILGLIVALLAAFGAWLLAGRVPTAVLDPRNPDIYFSSDISRVHANMATRESNHWRTNVHPLFSLQLHPLFQTVAILTGSDLSAGPLSSDAVAVSRLLSGLATGLTAGLLFVLLRAMQIRRPDSVLFCALAGTSAFSLFWFSIPETYPWGSASIVAALALAAVGKRRQLSTGWYVAASVLSLSITTTNWMAGILAMLTRFHWRKAAQWTVLALTLTFALAILQKAIFPSSRLFIQIAREKAYVLQESNGGPLRCWTSFFAHTVVMPKAIAAPHPKIEGLTVLRTQLSTPGSATIWGLPALICWTLLLAAGIYALFAVSGYLPLCLMLGALLLGQLGLHTVYGAETFLYSAHYGPLMIAMAALTTLTRLRIPVLILTALLIGFLTLNNFPEFHRTMELLAQSRERLEQLPLPEMN